MEPASLAEDLHDAFSSELDPGQQSALISWLAFSATFAAVRGITYSIRAGKGPFRNMSVGGEHLHHYMWGRISVDAGIGAISVTASYFAALPVLRKVRSHWAQRARPGANRPQQGF